MSTEKDIEEKTLESYNDVFADIMNVLLFDGRRVVKEDELEQSKTRSSYYTDEQVRDQERDESKFWRKHNVRIALVGFENQTNEDFDMPIRVIGYDGASYRSQLCPTKNEDGSSKRSNEPRYPVITIVLYFGSGHWNAPKTLYENLGYISDELKPFVSDYKINVFEIAYLDDETVGKFESDFRIIADYFVQMRKNKDYKPNPEQIHHVQEILKLMSYLTKDDRFEKTYYNSFKGVEYTNMCEVLDKVENIGLERGRAEGTERATFTAIKNLMDTMKWTAQQAMDALKIPDADRQKYVEQI